MTIICIAAGISFVCMPSMKCAMAREVCLKTVRGDMLELYSM